jgi:hypothetical protein
VRTSGLVKRLMTTVVAVSIPNVDAHPFADNIVRNGPLPSVASLDTLELFTRRAWTGMRTELESVLGHRAHIVDAVDPKTGQVWGERTILTRPARPVLELIRSWEGKRRFSYYRVDIATDYWFRTDQQVTDFDKFHRTFGWLRWASGKRKCRDEPDGHYRVAYERGEPRPAKNLHCYHKVQGRYHPTSCNIRPLMPVPVVLRDSPDLEKYQTYRVELAFKNTRAVRANDLHSIESLVSCDPRFHFDRHIAFVCPRPRWLSRAPHFWRQLLKHGHLDRRWLTFCPFTDVFPVPATISIPEK